MDLKKELDLIGFKEDLFYKDIIVKEFIEKIHGNPPRQYSDGISDIEFIFDYQAYLYIPGVTKMIIMECNFFDSAQETDWFRTTCGLSRRQFVLSDYLFERERFRYLAAYEDRLDEVESWYSEDIPRPSKADVLERLRLNANVSRRWWVESHLDDQQKQVYLEKYGDEVEKEDLKMKYGPEYAEYSEKDIKEIKESYKKEIKNEDSQMYITEPYIKTDLLQRLKEMYTQDKMPDWNDFSDKNDIENDDDFEELSRRFLNNKYGEDFINKYARYFNENRPRPLMMDEFGTHWDIKNVYVIDEDRKRIGLTRRQFVLSNIIPENYRETYLQTFADKFDEVDLTPDPNIPYPDNAEDLEKLRNRSHISRRWWVESHLDDYQKQVYLAQYSDEMES